MNSAARALSPFASRCIVTGALLAFLAVGLGAFGAHGLEGRVTPERLTAYRTGVLYHFLHALGILVCGALAQRGPASAALRWCVRLLVAGVMLFSGSLYALTAGAPTWVGMITPLGGLSFMLAWLMLARHGLSSAQESAAPGSE
jgi:uncharacterized membrane protein YgdD (TMEM256/DUF423 family)